MKPNRSHHSRKQLSGASSRKTRRSDNEENKHTGNVVPVASAEHSHSFKNALIDITALRDQSEAKPHQVGKTPVPKHRVSFKQCHPIQESTSKGNGDRNSVEAMSCSIQHDAGDSTDAKTKKSETRGLPQERKKEEESRNVASATAFDPASLQLRPAPQTSSSDPVAPVGVVRARPGSILAALDDHPVASQKGRLSKAAHDGEPEGRPDGGSVASGNSSSESIIHHQLRGVFTRISSTGRQIESHVHSATSSIPVQTPQIDVEHKPGHNDASKYESSVPRASREYDTLDEAVSRLVSINEKRDGVEHRPKVCMDIGEPVKDLLFLSNIPKEMTYDRLQDLVDSFGEVTFINWNANDSDCAEIMYEDPSSAKEAAHYLSDSIVGGSDDAPLRAELRSREPGTQLFVGDLTPDVTEAMLETTFSKLVQSPVSATLKRDPGSYSPIGYGFLNFENEYAANKALVEGHRIMVGNARVRVGRAERNTFLYVTDLNPDITMDELRDAFGKHGSIVQEDTVIVRRSYAFIRYRNRHSAESAKRTLDKTSLRGRMTVRYAEAEPLKSTVQVQFHSSVPRPPSSLKDLLHATFSKYGNCSVEIPRLSNGMWRKAAFVNYHGDPIAAALAATEAVQNVKNVSTIPVLCQFARELIPRVSPKGVPREYMASRAVDRAFQPGRLGDTRCQLDAASAGRSGRFAEPNGEYKHVDATGHTWHQDAVADEYRSHAGNTTSGKEHRLQGGMVRDDRVVCDENELPSVSVSSVEAAPSNTDSRKTESEFHKIDTSRYNAPVDCPPRADTHRQGSRPSTGPQRYGRSSISPSQTMRSPHGSPDVDVAYLPVYLPVSAVTNPYALSGMPGLLTETEFANAAAGFATPQYGAPLTPQFSNPMSPIMYHGGAVRSPVGPPPPFMYGMSHMGSMHSQPTNPNDM